MLQQFLCFHLESTAKFFGCLGIIDATIQIICIALDAEGIYRMLQQKQLTGGAAEFSLALILGVIGIFGVSSFCLILAAIKKRHNLIVPWLMNSPLYITFLYITAFKDDISTFSSCLNIAWLVYIWIAMLSLYRKIKKENATVSIPSDDAVLPKQIV